MKYFSVESLNEKLKFGKYSNKTLIEIFVENEGYGQWMLNEKGFDFAPGMKIFLVKALSITDRQQRSEYIISEYNNYMKFKKVTSKKTENILKQCKPIIGIGKLHQSTINGDCKWEVVYTKEGKKKYSVFYYDSEIILEMTIVKDKDTGKKKKKYVLAFSDGTIIAGHSDVVQLGEIVEKIAEKKKHYFEIREEELLSKYNKKIVNGSDIVVRTNMWYCIKKHNLIDVAASFKLLVHKKHEMVVINAVEHAAFCPQCGEFFIQETTYDSLKKRGYLLHRIIGHKQYKNVDNRDMGDMAEESLLHYMGYNVGKQDDLPDEVRWEILEKACDYGTMKKTEIITFLNHLINTNGGKNNMDDAVGKWVMDREHIQNYKIKNLHIVNVNGIKR